MWVVMFVMKKHYLWVLATALIFGAVSCKDKDKGPDVQSSTPETSSEVSPDPQTQDPVAPAPSPNLSAEKRGELVGFAKHLPADVEYLISLHDGSDITRRVMASKVWKTFAMMSGIPDGEELAEDGDDIIEEMFDGGPAAMFANEFTVAMGKGTSEQLQHLVLANSRLSFFQMSGLVQMMDAELGKDNGSSRRMSRFDEQFFLDLINDEDSGVGLFEDLNMPPTYIAFKTTDDNREMISQQVASGLQFFGMFDEMVETVDIKRGDSEFKGYRLVGAKIAKELEGEKEDMEEVMPSATADRLIKAVSKKNFTMLSGVHGDYVVIFAGSSPDQLVLVEDIGSSLAGGKALAFCDDYADKDVVAICYGNHEGLKSVMEQAKGSFADMSAGMRDGLSKSDNFGDTRDIDALLRMVEDRESALQAMSKVHGGGTIAFFDDGLRIESYGGIDSGYNDWKASNNLAVLGESSDVMLFANVTSNVDYDTKARDYIEALLETAYTGAMKFAELPIQQDDPGFQQFRQMIGLFDTKFRRDLLAFWDGFSNGFDGSLGQERALVIDLNGAMPAFPGIPQKMVDSAKFPRATWIAPVKDRSRLAGSWDKMNKSMTSITGTISEMMQEEIPMQKPMSSDKDGNTTWFFPLPFFNDDFLPSVTVNDNWFAASTSKLQALDLIGKADKGGKAGQGFVMRVDFKRLLTYANQMVDLFIEKNAEDIGIPGDTEDLKAILEAFSEIDSLNIHVRRDGGGQLRSSIHFKVAM